MFIPWQLARFQLRHFQRNHELKASEMLTPNFTYIFHFQITISPFGASGVGGDVGGKGLVLTHGRDNTDHASVAARKRGLFATDADAPQMTKIRFLVRAARDITTAISKRLSPEDCLFDHAGAQSSQRSICIPTNYMPREIYTIFELRSRAANHKLAREGSTRLHGGLHLLPHGKLGPFKLAHDEPLRRVALHVLFPKALVPLLQGSDVQQKMQP